MLDFARSDVRARGAAPGPTLSDPERSEQQGKGKEYETDCACHHGLLHRLITLMPSLDQDLRSPGSEVPDNRFWSITDPASTTDPATNKGTVTYPNAPVNGSVGR